MSSEIPKPSSQNGKVPHERNANPGHTPEGKFAKGNTLGGRRPGQPNRVTTEAKQAILRGISLAGADIAKYEKWSDIDGLVAFVRHLAKVKPEAAGALLGKLIPREHRVRSPISIRVITGMPEGLEEPGGDPARIGQGAGG